MRLRLCLFPLIVVALVLTACGPPPRKRPPLPPGTPLPAAAGDLAWEPVPVLGGFFLPTNIEFASNGRVWVSQKDGQIYTFDSIDDTTPTLTADLRDQVRSWGDHGILGMAIDPQFPVRPYLYVAHATDPLHKWGAGGDGCPSPPGSSVDGCLTGGRIIRLTLDSHGVATGQQITLADNRWCYQFPSHAIGDLQFLPDGTLLSGSGEGSNWADTDYGDFGGTWGTPPNYTPVNPCGDPTGGGPAPTASAGEGGALRAQDLLTPDDPQGWNGAIVRLDPDTGAPAAGNPLIGGTTADDDHIIAHGLRNPYRYTVDPATGDVLVADVGWTDYEEIDRFDPHETTVPNFGWPCWEGPYEQAAWASLKNKMCALAKTATISKLTGPWASFWHAREGAALSGISVVKHGPYDPRYDGQIVFADYVKQTVYTMPQTSRVNGDPSAAKPVAEGVAASDLQRAPDGYLYVVDVNVGKVFRLVERSQLALAKIQASKVDGPLPLSVTFDGSGSHNPTADPLTYQWDLNGDGQFDDATGPQASRTYTTPTNVTASLRVTTSSGATSTASVDLYPGNTPPQVHATITSPMPWTAGEIINFQISGSDAEDGVLQAPALSWATQLQHCATVDDCHLHPLDSAAGSTSGSVEGPGHEYPSFLRLSYAAVDSRGEKTTVADQLQPAVATLQVTSGPPQAQVVIGSTPHTTPVQVQFIKGSRVTVSTISPQTIGGLRYVFGYWSDNQPNTHVVAVNSDLTVKATMFLG